MSENSATGLAARLGCCKEQVNRCKTDLRETCCSSGGQMTNQLHPIWFRLRKQFYHKLELSAQSAGLVPEEALELALDLFGRFVVAAEQNKLDVKDFIADLLPVLRSLQKSADANKVGIVHAMQDAAKLFHMYGPIATTRPDYGDTSLRKSPTALAVLRWANVPADERSRRARELALKRWGSKKGTRPRAAGDKP